MQFSNEQLLVKKQEIITYLGLDSFPVNLSPVQTGKVLDTSVTTLSIWRSTGRYNLPYVKISRRVAYPLSAIAEFLLKREIRHTGEFVK